MFREEEVSVKYQRNEIWLQRLPRMQDLFSSSLSLFSLQSSPLLGGRRFSTFPSPQKRSELHLPGSHGGWAGNGSRMNHVSICTGFVIATQNHLWRRVLKTAPSLFHSIVLCLLLCNSEGQGNLACCSPWGCKELDKTEWLNNVC